MGMVERVRIRGAHRGEHDHAITLAEDAAGPSGCQVQSFVKAARRVDSAPIAPRAQLVVVSTPTTSRTAAAEARSIFFSSAVSFSFTISSTPAAPRRTGTPM